MAGRQIESASWADFTAAVAAAVSAGERVVISGARVSGVHSASAEPAEGAGPWARTG